VDEWMVDLNSSNVYYHYSLLYVLIVIITCVTIISATLFHYMVIK